MSSNSQDLLEPQDLLKGFIEVKGFIQNHHNVEHENGFNELKYWQTILYSVVISTVAETALQSLFVFKKRKNQRNFN